MRALLYWLGYVPKAQYDELNAQFDRLDLLFKQQNTMMMHTIEKYQMHNEWEMVKQEYKLKKRGIH